MKKHINVEIKAKCNDPEAVHKYLRTKNAQYKGEDHQVDIYFNCESGRLKLRKGNIENSLIFYNRSDQAGPKTSEITMASFNGDLGIDKVLLACLGEKVTVDKKRHIYFIENVKFHIDEVVGLGSFLEIEAIDKDGTLGFDRINEQCHFYLKELQISEADLIDRSYSDMLLVLRD